MLGAFADAWLPALDADELEAFENLLDHADDELHCLIAQGVAHMKRGVEALLVKLRKFHGLQDNLQDGQQA